MNDVIIAVIGSITTILTAVITGLFAKKEIEKSEANISEDFKAKLANERKSIFWKVIAIVAFFIGIIFTIAFTSAKQKWDKQNKINSVNNVYNELIQKGFQKTDGNPYIIPSIVINVNLEEVADSFDSHLEADYLIGYNTVYLKAVNDNKRAFDEGFRSNRGGEVIQLAGSDKQIITAESPTSKAWNLIYSTEIGCNRMTVTRFKVIYPNKILDYNSKFFGRLSDKEEEIAYPNTANDIIGEVVIMVSSSTLDLKLGELHNAAIGSLDDLNPSKWIEPTLTGYNVKGKIQKTIIARFPGLNDREVAKLKIGW